MNIIVLDLEWNKPKFNRKINKISTNLSEVIEVGAVKLDAKLKIIDWFNMLVKPQIYSLINSDVSELTGVTMVDLQKGKCFNDVINTFKEWLGEDYLFCIWGNDDINELQRNCKYYSIDDSCFNKYFDLQLQCSHYLNIDHRRIPLEKMQLFIKPIKIYRLHRALDDAFYTTEIFLRLNSLKDLNINLDKYSIDSKNANIQEIHYENSVRMKYKIVCPVCKKFIKRDFYHLNKRIYKFMAVGRCKKCNNFIFHMTKFKIYSQSKESYFIINNRTINEVEYSNRKDKIIKYNNNYLRFNKKEN